MRNRITLSLLLFLLVARVAVAEEPPCIIPVAIADRWADDDGDAWYDAGELYDPDLTGFRAAAHRGLLVTMMPAPPVSRVAWDTYFLVAFPPLGSETAPQTGGTWLRQRLSSCADENVVGGDSLLIEPGNLLDVLLEELEKRITDDPAAHWDAESESVRGSAFPTSPRLVALPCFDPTLPPFSTAPRLLIRKVAVFFLEFTESPGKVGLRLVSDVSFPASVESTTWTRVKSQFGGHE